MRRIQLKPKPSKLMQPCYRCGKTNHAAADCCNIPPATFVVKRAIAAACCSSTWCKPRPHSRKDKRRYSRHHVDQKESDREDSKKKTFHIFWFSKPACIWPGSKWLQVGDTQLIMEPDTGAVVSLISEATRKAKFLHLKLHMYKSSIVLKTYMYTGHPMRRPQANSMTVLGMEAKWLLLYLW